jgi:hypothetical protein
LVGVVLIASVVNSWFYLQTYSKVGQIQDIQSLQTIITKEKPNFLYGDNDLTPALAYLTNTPLLNTSIDTNPNIFRKGFLSAKDLTQKAINTKTIIVAHGAEYPSMAIHEPIIGEIYQIDIIKVRCKDIGGTNIIAEGIENRINLFKCY